MKSDCGLVVIYGQDLGRTFWLEPGQYTIGRTEACEIFVQGKGLSRAHARVSVDAELRVVVEDLGSTNGTCIDGQSVDRPMPLTYGAKLELGPVILKLVQREDLLGTDAHHFEPGIDGLTQLANAKVAKERLGEAIADATARPCSVLLFDIDGLNAINQRHGYLFGDELLVAVSRAVEPWLREEDSFGRITGSKWVVIARMGAGAAAELGETIRNVVATMAVPRGLEERVTVSVGVATLGQDDGSDVDVLGWAEAAREDAKEAGRNRVCVRAGPKR